MTYSFDELQGFLKDCRKHRTNILEKLAHGKDWTIDSFSDRANSRDELAKAVYYFENNLNQAMKLLDKVHSEHFAAVKELAEVRKDNGQLAIEAVNSLKSAIDEKLVDSAVDEAKGKTLDWSKIDFKKSISETVSKTVRAERKKERQIEEHKNSFMLFGAQEEFVGDGENAEWNNTESLVKDILDECGVDDQNIMRIEKLGRGGNNPVKYKSYRLIIDNSRIVQCCTLAVNTCKFSTLPLICLLCCSLSVFVFRTLKIRSLAVTY
ncbi:hypothetical protein ACHWQZ_G009017 [Mnemiopsis leidyi]